MEEDFSEDFAQFKTKIDSFVASTHFHIKRSEHEGVLHHIESIVLDDMKEDIKNSTDFRKALEQSHDLMKKIVSAYNTLDSLFKMDQDTLAKFSGHDINMLNKSVSKHLSDIADLEHQFDLASAKTRKIIEVIEDPFIYQGM